jgi:hypothetical protein
VTLAAVVVIELNQFLAMVLPFLVFASMTLLQSTRLTSAFSTGWTSSNGRSMCTHLVASLQPGQDPDYSSEETLLCLNLSVLPNVSMNEAKKRVSNYCKSFPFAAVLPVQPLSYLPTTDDGVELLFLRKKTGEKSGVDGGMRFFLDATSENDLEVIVKRKSLGQSITKIFAERLVTTSFVAGISGEETERFGKPPADVVRVQSVFHKWMDSSPQ